MNLAEQFSLTDRVALVTGASRGIGAATADALGAAGATVVGTATSEAGAASISARFAERDIRGRGVVLDVCDTDSIAALHDDITGAEGCATIVVNNAGITSDNLMMRMKEEQWDAVIDTDLSSAYRVSKAFLRGMIKARYGRIVNISSVVAATGNAGQTNYAAAKAGLVGFTKSLAREVASRGITVNAVAPGYINTDMTEVLNDDQKVGLVGQIPLERLGSPDDVAGAVLFLVTPAGSYITGETLHVNGGMCMI